MAQLPFGNFDANEVEPGGKMVAEPAFTGWHRMHFTESEMKPTKSGTGNYAQFVAEVLDGPYKGRKLWVRLNLDNPNQTAVEIAHRELSSMCRACGVMNISDTQQLHHRPFLGNVEYEPANDKGSARNNLVAYKPVEGGYAPPSPAAAGAPAPAASATPPWMRKSA